MTKKYLVITSNPTCYIGPFKTRDAAIRHGGFGSEYWWVAELDAPCPYTEAEIDAAMAEIRRRDAHRPPRIATSGVDDAP